VGGVRLELLLRPMLRWEALVDENRRLRAENRALRHAAVHDPLTGLLNRAGLAGVAGEVLGGAGSGVQGAVMLLDLNLFKQVNDRLGHEVGDRVLQEVAARLRRYAGGWWRLLARLGGDEFVGVGTGREGAAVAGARRLAVVLSAPMCIGGRDLAVGAAVGVAVADVPVGLGEMLRRADEAMYRAKGLPQPAVAVWSRDGCGDGSLAGPRPRLRTRDLPRVRTREGHAPAPGWHGPTAQPGVAVGVSR
jgi:diguanylate cyclase (GGDEF)-like protein